jgi:hypothetical protein
MENIGNATSWLKGLPRPTSLGLGSQWPPVLDTTQRSGGPGGPALAEGTESPPCSSRVATTLAQRQTTLHRIGRSFEVGRQAHPAAHGPPGSYKRGVKPA